MVNKILLNKNMVPLCKIGSEFIYIDTVSNQFYTVRESKIFKNVDFIIYISSIFGVTIFRKFILIFNTRFPIIYRLGALLTIIIVAMIISRSQLKKWENYINFSQIKPSEQMKKEILKEALNTQKNNTFVLLFLSSIFISTSIIFIITFGYIFMILTMIFAYVIALLLPTLKLNARKDFISNF